MTRYLKQIRGFQVLLMMVMVFTLQACAYTSPYEAAETPGQKALALLGPYDIIQADAEGVVNDASIPLSVRRAVQRAEDVATPVILELDKAFAKYQVISAQLAQGQSTQEKLDIATANLNDWIRQAEEAIADLGTAIAGG